MVYYIVSLIVDIAGLENLISKSPGRNLLFTYSKFSIINSIEFNFVLVMLKSIGYSIYAYIEWIIIYYKFTYLPYSIFCKIYWTLLFSSCIFSFSIP